MYKWRRLTALKLVIAHFAHSCKMHYIATAYHHFVSFMVNTTSLTANIVICKVQYWHFPYLLLDSIIHRILEGIFRFLDHDKEHTVGPCLLYSCFVFCGLFFLWTFNLQQCLLTIITCHFYLSKKKHLLHNHSQIAVTTFHFVWFFWK